MEVDLDVQVWEDGGDLWDLLEDEDHVFHVLLDFVMKIRSPDHFSNLVGLQVLLLSALILSFKIGQDVYLIVVLLDDFLLFWGERQEVDLVLFEMVIVVYGLGIDREIYLDLEDRGQGGQVLRMGG